MTIKYLSTFTLRDVVEKLKSTNIHRRVKYGLLDDDI